MREQTAIKQEEYPEHSNSTGQIPST